ncbi:MAG: monovalent cation/H(+) antiporter subunit G [Anaerolineae bacterium]
MVVLQILGLVVLWIGVGFSVLGIVGMIRMPDLYCRLHASGKVSTVGLCGLLLGTAILMPSVALKLVALAVFAVLTLPVSTHAIAAAAYRHGVPMSKAIRDDMASKTMDEELSRAS